MSKNESKSKSQFLEQLEAKVNSLKKILELNQDKKEESLKYSVSFENNTKIKFLSYDELEMFNELIDSVLSYAEIGERFSRIYIEKEIINIFHKVLADTIDISSELDLFYSNLKNSSNDEWFIISEIENMKLLKSTPFQLIDCTIKHIFRSDFPLGGNLTEKEGFDYLQKSCIYTTVKAGDAEKAESLAQKNFTLAFSLLKLYFPHPNFNPALKGTLVSGDQNILNYNMTKKKITNSSRITGDLLLNIAYLNDELYSFLRQKGIVELSKDSSITRVIKECLYWHKVGLDEELLSGKLLNFVTVLESSLKKKGEMNELKQRVADRCALMLGSGFDDRKDIVKNISAIYNIRSKIVHTGVIIEDKNLAELAGGYARAVLIELIQKNSYYQGNFEKFIDDIDDKKYL